ncbi:hypothetical protein [Colwellia psychrerythraea]|uniref:Uncharacterized protein n=1 Tax=Colwellia psychrerythraea TaxID=28229 RepID=A0A099KB81_COLPS|nr:hypothetical protein [Colwellia psychrerythraea]KGJ87571.1 hypothetical protein ND2E_4309 [Colwellia psychrerythraea]
MKTISQIALTCIILLSVLLITSSVGSSEIIEQDNESVLPFKSIVLPYSYEKTVDIVKTAIQEDCRDCNTKTCQCCSPTLFIYTTLMISVNAFALSFHHYQTSQTDMFYDLVLRPPIASVFYSS